MNSCRNPCKASVLLPPSTFHLLPPTSIPDMFSSSFFPCLPAVHAQLWSWLQAPRGLVQERRERGNTARVQVSQTRPAYLQGALQPAALPTPSVGDRSVGRGESGYDHLK